MFMQHERDQEYFKEQSDKYGLSVVTEYMALYIGVPPDKVKQFSIDHHISLIKLVEMNDLCMQLLQVPKVETIDPSYILEILVYLRDIEPTVFKQFVEFTGGHLLDRLKRAGFTDRLKYYADINVNLRSPSYYILYEWVTGWWDRLMDTFSSFIPPRRDWERFLAQFEIEGRLFRRQYGRELRHLL